MKYNKTALILSLSMLIIVQSGLAQDAEVRYTESKEDFANPERGFYIPEGTRAGHFVPLETAAIRRVFAGPQKHGSAHYAIYSTLLLREYTLDTFLTGPLSPAFLDNVSRDLDAVREAGLKVILRFAYTNTARTGSCPDVNKICPPYGDAAKSIVLDHIRQLEPLLRRHADVIAVLQEGFIGIWGENYYTDYFGDASGNGPGRIPDSAWRDRNEVLHALLAALPADRMIQVRTPQIKQKYVYGPEASVESSPLKSGMAFLYTDPSRIGFHNDCFLSGPDDYGTYYDYGSSGEPKKPANETLRRYFQQDSRYVAVGGETCDDVYSPQNDCAPSGHAEEDMAALHYSFLNTAYNNDVNNDWDSLGCISSIQRRLGYRFVLRKAFFPSIVKAGHSFSLRILLDNVGYASPFNPRPVRLVLRNQTSSKEWSLACQADPRTWYSGSVDWRETLSLPADLPAGDYVLLLDFPDAYPSLAHRPQYSIRLANEGIWEEQTGYNKLQYVLKVSGPGKDSSGLAVPAGNRLLLRAYAKGVQIYRCTQDAKDSSHYSWTFVAPEADLFLKTNYTHPIGRHYAGPVWENSDGSKVKGTKLQQADAPDAMAIPWLLLRGAQDTTATVHDGIFSKVSYIQRINTRGGKAPASASREQLGQQVRVPYTAEYLFYSPE